MKSSARRGLMYSLRHNTEYRKGVGIIFLVLLSILLGTTVLAVSNGVDLPAFAGSYDYYLNNPCRSMGTEGECNEKNNQLNRKQCAWATCSSGKSICYKVSQGKTAACNRYGGSKSTKSGKGGIVSTPTPTPKASPGKPDLLPGRPKPGISTSPQPSFTYIYKTEKKKMCYEGGDCRYEYRRLKCKKLSSGVVGSCDVVRTWNGPWLTNSASDTSVWKTL